MSEFAYGVRAGRHLQRTEMDHSETAGTRNAPYLTPAFPSRLHSVAILDLLSLANIRQSFEPNWRLLCSNLLLDLAGIWTDAPRAQRALPLDGRYPYRMA